MNNNVKQSTISATQRDITTVRKPLSSETQLSPAPLYTVADLQKSLRPNSTGTIGGTTPAADAEILSDILRTIKSTERRQLCFRVLFLFLFLLLPITWIYILLFCTHHSRHVLATKKVAKDGVRYMIRLEGDQWSRYVEHIFAESPRKMKKKQNRKENKQTKKNAEKY